MFEDQVQVQNGWRCWDGCKYSLVFVVFKVIWVGNEKTDQGIVGQALQHRPKKETTNCA